MKTAVVGGGISGLTAAFELKKAGSDFVLYEKADVPGSSIRTSTLGPVALVEEGADAFLARSSFGYELCEELEISLTSPVSAKILISKDGEMFPPIAPHILGVPIDPEIKAQDDILNSLKADFERTNITEPPLEEETVGSFVRRRIGDEIYEHQVAPLVGAISASNPDLLSLQVAAPLLAKAREESPSLIKGLISAAQSGKSGRPAFYAPDKGMGEIPKRLSQELGDAVCLNSKVKNLDDISADAFILALPLHISSQLVAEIAPEAARTLGDIEYTSVCLAQLIYEKENIPQRFSELAGILFQDGDITAISFATQKWSHYTDENSVVLRVSVGRYGADEIVKNSDSTILQLIQNELLEKLDIKAPPKWSRISRWPKSFPQYFPGHKQKIESIEIELAKHNIYLAGAGLAGVGVPACIESGIRAAEKTITNI